MTFREKHQTTKDWYEKCAVVHMFHAAKLATAKNWGINETAHYFQISHGNVSECITVCENSVKVKHCKSKNEALKVIRNAD